jgi:adenylate kinase
MNNLIFVGPPGAGKGTQANLLKKKNYIHVSTGDLLRAEVSSGSELGKEIENIISQGKLVSDEIVEKLLIKNLDIDNNCYIFDGYPRNKLQAAILQKILGNKPYKIIIFDADLDKIADRICNRRLAPISGEIYNLVSRPPKVDGICDLTGEKLIHRDDDKIDVVENRFKIYKETKDEILNFYGVENTICIDADKDPSSVYEELINNLN